MIKDNCVTGWPSAVSLCGRLKGTEAGIAPVPAPSDPPSIAFTVVLAKDNIV